MQRNLDGGLILRSISAGVASDRENLATFYSETFSETSGEDESALYHWVNDLLAPHHPSVTDDDMWVVVDPAQEDKIVSAVLLIPQTWRFGDIAVPVGRVELVATHKDYRRRGLVRAQIETAHARSEALGHLMQGITGIGHYYRRFGYTMAVDLGTRSLYPLSLIPKVPEPKPDAKPDAKPDTTPRFTVRRAAATDIPNLMAWEAYRAQRAGLSLLRSENEWRYELEGRHPDAPFHLYIHIVTNASGEDVGFFSVRALPAFKQLGCMHIVIGEKASYLDTFDDILRGIGSFVEAFRQDKPDFAPPLIEFDSSQSPHLDTMFSRTWGVVLRPDANVYAWYLRVADLGRFIRHVAPVLERRLEGSGANRYTGSLKIGFYDLTGLEITFEQGRIVDAVARAFDQHEGDAEFPYLTFLNVLFGHRSEIDIRAALPETYGTRKAMMLMQALFPRERHYLYALA